MKNTLEIAGALVRRRRGVLLSSARAVANPRRGHSVAAIRVAPSTGAEIGCGGAGASLYMAAGWLDRAKAAGGPITRSAAPLTLTGESGSP